MRIALTIPYLPPYLSGQSGTIYGDVIVGGAETWGWDFAQALARTGLELDLYTADVPAAQPGWTEIRGIPAYRVPVSDRVDIVPIMNEQYVTELARHDYDVFHFSLFAHRNFADMRDLARARNKVVVFSHHGCGLITSDEEERRRFSHALADSDLITVPSLSSLEHYTSSWIRRKIRVLPNGVDIARFRPAAWDASHRSPEEYRRYRFGDDRPVVLFVGRLMAHKGVLFLIDAFDQLLRRRSSARRPRLVIAGTGEQEDELRGFCQDRGYGDGDDIVFTGFVAERELPALLASAEALVLPSVRTGYRGERFMEPEAFGLVLTEAMGCGTPCVGFAIPGVSSVITHNFNGLLAEEGNAAELATHLERIIGDPGLRTRLRQGALYSTNAVFSYDRIASRYRDMIEQYVTERMITGPRQGVKAEPRAAAGAISPSRPTVSFFAPSTTQFYSGQGRHLFESAKFLLDGFKIEIVTDDLIKSNLRALIDYCDHFPVKLTILKGLPPNGTLDPQVPDLRAHISNLPRDTILCPIGWANTVVAETVGECGAGSPVAFVPHYQPPDTVPGINAEIERRLVRALNGLLARADSVFVLSHEEWAIIQPRVRGRLFLHQHGINNDVFRYAPVRKESMALFVGDLREPRKRLALTLRVFLEIHKRFPQMRLGVVGRYDHREAIEHLIPDPLRGAVELLGYVADEDLAILYNRAMLLINTASYEAFCIPLIEAMACGAVPLVTRTGGVPSVVDDGLTGFLLDPDDPVSSLSQVWPTLENPAQFATMSNRVRHAARQDFSWEGCADVLDVGLRHALAESGAAKAPHRSLRSQKSRRKVLFINDYFAPDLVGGAGVYLQLLAAGLAPQCELTVLRHGSRARQESVQGIDIRWQPYHLESGLGLDPAEFDIVHVNTVHELNPVHYARLPAEHTLLDVHDYWPVCPNRELVYQPDLPRITRCGHAYRSWDDSPCAGCFGESGKSLMETRDRLVDRATALLCHSDFMKRKLAARFSTKSVNRIYYGIRHEDFQGRAATRSAKFRILWIGRVSLTKGVTLLDEMIPMLARQLPDFELLIAGDYLQLPDWYRPFAEKMAAWGLGGFVRFLGKVPLAETPMLFSNADVTIIPSLWDEPFGIVAIESLAAGCPVIAASVGGLGEIFQDGVESFYVERPTVQNFVARIVYIAQNRGRLCDLTNAGQRLVRERYTVEVMSEQVLALYDRLDSAVPV
jgi:glycogen synthase